MFFFCLALGGWFLVGLSSSRCGVPLVAWVVALLGLLLVVLLLLLASAVVGLGLVALVVGSCLWSLGLGGVFWCAALLVLLV